MHSHCYFGLVYADISYYTLLTIHNFVMFNRNTTCDFRLIQWLIAFITVQFIQLITCFTHQFLLPLNHGRMTYDYFRNAKYTVNLIMLGFIFGFFMLVAVPVGIFILGSCPQACTGVINSQKNRSEIIYHIDDGLQYCLLCYFD